LQHIPCSPTLTPSLFQRGRDRRSRNYSFYSFSHEPDIFALPPFLPVFFQLIRPPFRFPRFPPALPLLQTSNTCPFTRPFSTLIPGTGYFFSTVSSHYPPPNVLLSPENSLPFRSPPFHLGTRVLIRISNSGFCFIFSLPPFFVNVMGSTVSSLPFLFPHLFLPIRPLEISGNNKIVSAAFSFRGKFYSVSFLLFFSYYFPPFLFLPLSSVGVNLPTFKVRPTFVAPLSPC